MNSRILSFRLSIFFLILVIILSGITILLGYSYVKNLMFESNRYRLQFEVRETLDDLENSMDDAVRFVKHLAHDFSQEELQADPTKFMLIAFENQPNTILISLDVSDILSQHKSDYTLLRSEETILSNNQKITFRNQETEEWINRMVVKTKPEWSAPFFNTELEARVMIYAYPFDYLNHGLKSHATFFCAIKLDHHLKNLNNQKMIQSGLAVLLNRNDQIIYHPDIKETGRSVNSAIRFNSFGNIDFKKLLKDRPSGYQLIHTTDNFLNRNVIIYWPLKSAQWYLIIAIPENLFISAFKRFLLFFITLLLFTGSVVASIVIYNSAKLVTPISSLAIDTSIMVDGAGPEHNSWQKKSNNLVDRTIHKLFSSRHLNPSLNDINALTFNLEKINEQLVHYRQSHIQSSLDKIQIDKELSLASDIEMRMIPTIFPLVPDRTDFDCFGKLIPAKIVGGDLFDLFFLDDQNLFISITDTVGKGIPAAMYSVMTRTFIRSIANPITRLGKMMESLNDALTLVHDSEMFATVFLGKLNLVTGEIIYCNAGHPYPFILRNNHSEEYVNQSHGIPVGIKRNLTYSESRIWLLPGETLITYTDGITDQNDEEGHFFGIERLIKTAKNYQESTTQIIVNEIISTIDRFKGNAEVHDDSTLVAVKFLG